MNQEPDLAEQVADWYDRRRRVGRYQARDLAKPLVADLEHRHERISQHQVRRLLSAEADIADEHPGLLRLAATLAKGRLVDALAITVLEQPAMQSRAEIQQTILGDYTVQRAAAVERQWAALGRRDRCRSSWEEIEADHDDRNLCVCDTCALVYPLPPNGEPISRRCRHCYGTILNWPDRAAVVPFADRLNAIRS